MEGVDDMKMRLEQKQMLKMVMTTELRQAIELLQLSTYDLEQFIQDQAEENPLIELVEKVDYDHHAAPRRTGSSGESFDPLSIVASKEASIYDHLLEQIIAIPLNENENAILRYLILNIDAQGYLTVTDEEVRDHLQVSLQAAEEARLLLWGLEPVGIGARNVKECLLIQAKRKYVDDDLLSKIIDHYLEPLANKQWKEIAEQLDVSVKNIHEKHEIIQTFNPRPAANFTVELSSYVEPDIYIELHPEKNTFFITLNESVIPDIQFNNQYAQFGKDKEEIGRAHV